MLHVLAKHLFKSVILYVNLIKSVVPKKIQSFEFYENVFFLCDHIDETLLLYCTLLYCTTTCTVLNWYNSTFHVHFKLYKWAFAAHTNFEFSIWFNSRSINTINLSIQLVCVIKRIILLKVRERCQRYTFIFR